MALEGGGVCRFGCLVGLVGPVCLGWKVEWVCVSGESCGSGWSGLDVVSPIHVRGPLIRDRGLHARSRWYIQEGLIAEVVVRFTIHRKGGRVERERFVKQGAKLTLHVSELNLRLNMKRVFLPIGCPGHVYTVCDQSDRS